jgi:hypothetical protein
MTQFSMLWNCPGGAGDGLNSLTRADWAIIGKIFAACGSPEGVAPGYLNELAGTVTGANTVSLNSGAGLVDGKPYQNDAALAVNVPSAVGAGNTRKDRIVLRADWTAQTVRIFRIAGIDAAAPTIPATSQISGTLYDVPLYVATVNTAGTVTLVDERWFAQAVTSGIKDANVTLAKMAANSVGSSQIVADSVDDTKAGNRVLALPKRLGGNVTDWYSSGTTEYTPTAVRIQVGMCVSAIDPYIDIVFPDAFGAKPLVFLQPITDLDRTPYPSVVTSTGFRANIGSPATPILWLAIGPE